VLRFKPCTFRIRISPLISSTSLQPRIEEHCILQNGQSFAYLTTPFHLVGFIWGRQFIATLAFWCISAMVPPICWASVRARSADKPDSQWDRSMIANGDMEMIVAYFEVLFPYWLWGTEEHCMSFQILKETWINIKITRLPTLLGTRDLLNTKQEW